MKWMLVSSTICIINSDNAKRVRADGDGHLSRSELRVAFKKLGHDLNDKQLNSIFAQVDVDGSGKISFDGKRRSPIGG